MSATVSTSPIERPLQILELAWSVSPDALCRALGRRATRVTLTLMARRDGSGETRLVAGDDLLARFEHNAGAVVITRDPERGLEHIDVEGVLACTRRGDEVLFARAPALTSLGLEGGRYHPAPTKDADRDRDRRPLKSV